MSFLSLWGAGALRGMRSKQTGSHSWWVKEGALGEGWWGGCGGWERGASNPQGSHAKRGVKTKWLGNEGGNLLFLFFFIDWFLENCLKQEAPVWTICNRGGCFLWWFLVALLCYDCLCCVGVLMAGWVCRGVALVNVLGKSDRQTGRQSDRLLY